MTSPACHALRATTCRTFSLACRAIAARRVSRLRKDISPSLTNQRHNSSTPASQPSDDNPLHNVLPFIGKKSSDQTEETNPTESSGGPPGPSRRPKASGRYGSPSKRSARNATKRKAEKKKEAQLPSWFKDRNIILVDDAASTPLNGDSSQSSSPDHFGVNPNIDAEIQALIRSGMRSKDSEDIETHRPNLMLQCFSDAAASTMQDYVWHLAKTHGLDFLKCSPQDLAELSDNVSADMRDDYNMGSLGYEVAEMKRDREAAENEDADEDVERVEDEEEEHISGPFTPSRGAIGPLGINPSMLRNTAIVASVKVDDFLKSAGKGLHSFNNDDKPSSDSLHARKWRMKHMTRDGPSIILVDLMLNAVTAKREAVSAGPDDQKSSKSGPDSARIAPQKDGRSALVPDEARKGLVVLIEDYAQLDMTPMGDRFLQNLREEVETRREKGHPIIIVGLSSLDPDYLGSPKESLVSRAQGNSFGGSFRTVVVPMQEQDEGALKAEQKKKFHNLNMRHLGMMLKKVASNPAQIEDIVNDRDLRIDSKYAFISGLEQSAWPQDKVHRLAHTALGLIGPLKHVTAHTIEQAIGLIDMSDEVKTASFKQIEKDKFSKGDKTSATRSAPEDVNEKVRKLRHTCSVHEKKLLSGIIDPKNIRTTFSDVQAPAETIDALRTLTSLSLMRPDAFKYGVLATDRIPGLLLYGPPGTGKTLLAKAVAKESGAAVLEVSGSDVYDMYVGEGEKNVRAIFSLAKKLSPCIVFIDEADAILGARGEGPGRTSHRELINQFLREWDGMTETSAFIMVATNRPFDLDEASLRRVPRRLLVDLPMEQDREAILRIHLKDEKLDDSVSISSLAAQTPFYSGSDLKNICVAAALACVREEIDAATAHNRDHPDDSYKYAERRLLFPRHFDKALAEISASVSDDMGSLSAIRKFDEKYGDRKGRRKKLGGYGFKTVEDAEKLGSDVARVRKRTT